MKQHLEEKLALAQGRLATAQQRADEMEMRARAAEERFTEAREIMLDLLIALGMRDICAKCGSATFWLRPRGQGGARLFNLDGTEHWPCPGGQTPNIDSADERTNNL